MKKNFPFDIFYARKTKFVRANGLFMRGKIDLCAENDLLCSTKHSFDKMMIFCPPETTFKRRFISKIPIQFRHTQKPTTTADVFRPAKNSNH